MTIKIVDLIFIGLVISFIVLVLIARMIQGDSFPNWAVITVISLKIMLLALYFSSDNMKERYSGKTK